METIIFDTAVCGHCRSLINGILTSTTNSANGWQTIQSIHAQLTYFQRHLNNTMHRLAISAASGCKLCALMADEIKIFYGENSTPEYCIFIWGRTPTKAEFKIASGKIEKYLEHIARHSRPLSVALFQNMPATLQGLSNKSKHGSEIVFKTIINAFGLRLVLYLSHGEVHSYAALSYSWGGKGRLFTTTKATLDERCKGFELEDLPTTLQDGVKVAKALGFRYIWIDSLCIIQDDTKDWIHEGRAMTEIYGKSTLNISASSSTGSDEGFLWKLSDHGVAIGRFSSSTTTYDDGIFVGTPLRTLDLEEKEVSNRGWIFQERLVSVSTIHYTNEGLIWECVTDTCLKHNQNLTSVRWKSQWNDLVNLKRHNLAKNNENAVNAQDKFVVWHQWINAYSSRNLFAWTDKFPAIAGVTKTFAETFDLTWCAGLWQQNLLGDLLWRRHNRNPTLERPSVSIAPTWSWASVNGQIEYREVNVTQSETSSNLKVLGCNVEERYSHSFGEVKEGGHIIAEGLLQAVVVDTAFHPGVRQKSFQECVLSKGFKNNCNVLCMLDEFHEGMERFVSCWCLRVASFLIYGRQGDMYLLLKRICKDESKFCRIGLAETDPWEQGNTEIANSGVFTMGSWQRLVLM